MAYFKINDKDFTEYVSGLKVSKAANYNSQTNAAGNSVIDYINTKRVVEVKIIPLTAAAMVSLQTAISNTNITITFLNPDTNTLETYKTFLEKSNVEYYTIQTQKVLFKQFTLIFAEL